MEQTGHYAYLPQGTAASSPSEGSAVPVQSSGLAPVPETYTVLAYSDHVAKADAA